MRDNKWLQDKLDLIWVRFFSDVPRKNQVKARFVGNWKNKFGHIKEVKEKNTEIVVNGFFKREDIIPEWIIYLTLAHELVHYSHGFHSPLPRLYRQPHQGGIVTRELKKRGFGELLKREKEWIKRDWEEIVKKEFTKKRRATWF